MNTFSGISPEKSRVRAAAYSYLSKKQFYTRIHVVIASRECGDIHYLLQHKVPAKNIIACDTDPLAVEAARELGVPAFQEDIRATAKWAVDKYKSKVASLNIDLCNSVNKGAPILREIVGGLPWIGFPAKVFFTYARYHDGRCNGDRERLAIAREAAYCNQSKANILAEMPYQSWTATSKGSPMTTMVFSYE